MSLRLEGQVAIVTGGSSGIGRATCLALAREGAHVVALGRSAERLDETLDLLRPETDRRGGRAIALALDVRSEADMREMADRTLQGFGRVDVLVGSAGIARPDGSRRRALAETPADDFDQVVATNLKGLFLSCRAVLPAMVRQGRGDVLNLASTAGLAGLAFDGPYCASKAGAIGLSEAMAEEVGPLGVRVQVLVPGPFETEMWRQGGSRLRPGGQIPPCRRVADAAVYLLTLPRDVRLVSPVVKPQALSLLGGVLGGFGSTTPSAGGEPPVDRPRQAGERSTGPTGGPRRLSGKVVVVTGGSGGLGLAVCRAAAGEGAALVVADRDPSRVDEAVAGLPPTAGPAVGHLGFALDVRDEAGNQALAAATLDRFGRIDALVTCDADALGRRGPSPRPLAETTVGEWDEALDTHLRGVFLSNRAVLPTMTRRRSGLVLNLTTAQAFQGRDGAGPARASGFAVVGLSQSIAAEVRGVGVKVQAVSPEGAGRTEAVAALVLFLLTQAEDAVLDGPVIAPLGARRRKADGVGLGP